MTGKLVSLFTHPEFVRRSQARYQRELAERVVPVLRLGPGSFRCQRCWLEFQTLPPPPAEGRCESLERCPQCDPILEVDVLDAFLEQLMKDL
jgi:hypothetical protein